MIYKYKAVSQSGEIIEGFFNGDSESRSNIYAKRQ